MAPWATHLSATYPCVVLSTPHRRLDRVFYYTVGAQVSRLKGLTLNEFYLKFIGAKAILIFINLF